MECKNTTVRVNVFITAFHQTLILFAVLFIVTLPFAFPFPPSMPANAFERWYQLAGIKIFRLHQGFNARVESDSPGMYIHVLFLFLLSFFTVALWVLLRKKPIFSDRIIRLLSLFIAYYLAFQLMTYGFSKLFKWQFYLPEPNTLFTTPGETHRDLLYWSTLGVSRAYNIFTGAAEIFVAIMLLFRRTRMPGACAAAVLLINIIAVNFAFDISVKLLSCFLFLLAALIIWPHAKSLTGFFFRSNQNENILVGKYSIRIFALVKAGVLLLMLCSVLYPYFHSKNFNDDNAPRPKFHGAYDVTTFIKNADTLPPLLTDTSRWRRVFIHRKNYFIIQKMNDEMVDLEFFVDSTRKQLISEEFIFDYAELQGHDLQLTGLFKNDSLKIMMINIDLKKLPLLQNEFHWTGN